MARDHAQVNLAIWNDDDWLDLPPAAQHLYFVLVTHPGLSFAGVVEWRPARIAALAGGWTPEDVRRAAACLEARLFVVIDEATEECLVRSWVRFDGLLKQPILAVSFTKARAAVASREIRAVIVHEAQKHHAREPDLAGWGKPQVQELLGQRALDPRDRTLPDDPFTPGATPHVTPRLTLSPGVGVNPAPNPSPTPAPAPAPLLPALLDIAVPVEKAKSTAPATPSLFDDFYDAYPKKSGKQAAVKAFAKVIQRGADARDIIAGAQRYRDDPNLPDRQYIPDPGTWLNAGRWDDEPCPPRLDRNQKPIEAPNPMHARLERELAERKRNQQ